MNQRDRIAVLLKELFTYFELENGEWPTVPVHTEDGPTFGFIDDQIYHILVELAREIDS